MLGKHRGKWVVKHDGRKFSTGLDATEENRARAERKAREFVKAATVAGDTLADIFPAYVNDRQALSKARQLGSWKRLKPFFGSTRYNHITRDLCRDYIARRRKQGVSDGTIRRELTDLRAAVNWYDKRNDAQFAMPPAPAPKDHYLTKDDFRKLLECAETPHLRLFLHLAIATAARKEALFTLTWDQVIWSRDQIWLGKKTGGKGRAIVPMTATLRRELEAALELQEPGVTTVLSFRGEPIKSIRTSLAKAAARAGVEVTPHVLRHSAAVWMAEDGHSMDEIAQYLGHSNTAITARVYARYSPDHLRKLASSLEL